MPCSLTVSGTDSSHARLYKRRQDGETKCAHVSIDGRSVSRWGGAIYQSRVFGNHINDCTLGLDVAVSWADYFGNCFGIYVGSVRVSIFNKGGDDEQSDVV